MTDNVLSHNEMCRREGVSLQRGMNFGLGGNHSVILMSVRPNAPYRDRLEDSGTTLIYEGHDQPKTILCPNPKMVDQPGGLPSGKLTQNGKFHEAAQRFKNGERAPDRVRVYEKLRSGIWSYNGVFHLIDAWQERDKHRMVYKFKLVAVEGDEDFAQPVHMDAERRRIIPTAVKLEIWKRDGGKCRLCEAKDELHFDHIVPFSGVAPHSQLRMSNFCAHVITCRSEITSNERPRIIREETAVPVTIVHHRRDHPMPA